MEMNLNNYKDVKTLKDYHEMFQATLKAADKDGDGKIDAKEFAQMAQNNPDLFNFIQECNDGPGLASQALFSGDKEMTESEFLGVVISNLEKKAGKEDRDGDGKVNLKDFGAASDELNMLKKDAEAVYKLDKEKEDIELVKKYNGKTVADLKKAGVSADVIKRVDVNGDGKVNLTDFGKSSDEIGLAQRDLETVLKKDQVYEDLIYTKNNYNKSVPDAEKRIDVNNNGKIDMQDMVALALQIDTVEKNANTVLDKIKAEKDAELVQKYFGKTVAELKKAGVSAEIIKRIDVNGDGKINISDFCKIADNLSKLQQATKKIHKNEDLDLISKYFNKKVADLRKAGVSEDIISKIDLNGDGIINIQDLGIAAKQ
jgi:Ca2+-binding EF-hand superfamily protein